MFEKMLGMVKGKVADIVGGMDSVPQEKQGAVVDTAASSLMNGLRQYANPSALGALLGGGAKGGATGGAAEMVGSLLSGVAADLTSKAGLTSSAAQGVAGKIVPAVMSLLQKHVGDDAQPGFNLQSMIGALTGGGGAGTPGKGGGVTGILGGLGSLFGKKG